MNHTSGFRPGHLFAGRYQIERLIKAGGMGAVYVAVHAQTFRKVALKLMDPSLVANVDARQRFQQEARVATLIQSAHVVDVLDADVDESTGTPFLVMELLQGCDLSEVIEKRGHLPPAEVVWVMGQVAKALDRAHAAGIVHRDLKPENLYLTQRDDEPPRVKILDFGIAKMVQGANANATRATGTVPFMAPEQTQTSGNIAPHTDVWAFGLTAYAMLVGQSYWAAQDVHQMYAEILFQPLTSAVARAAQHGIQLPPDFDRWFFGCVNREPSQRFQRAGDAYAALAQSLGVAQSTPTPPLLAAVGAGATQYATPAPIGATPHPGWATPQPQHATPAPGWPTPQPTGTAPPGFPNGTAMMPSGQMPRPTTTNSPVQSPPYVLPPPSSATPPPPSRTPLIIGAVVVALGTLVAVVVLSRPSTPTGEIDDTPTKKPKPGPPSAGTTTGSDERDDGPKKKKPLREQIDALDAFVPIGSGSMQRHEVTREEYGLYLASLSEKERGKARPLKEWESDEPDASTKRLPVTWVSFERATRFCKAIDATLPTKEQWTEALDGAFPWGPTWPKTLEGIALGAGESAKVKEVETASKDKTSDGVYDLGGNVQEWTSSVADGMATVRGGSIAMEGSDAKAAISEGTSQFTEVAAGDNAKVDAIAGPRLGFRCFRGK